MNIDKNIPRHYPSEGGLKPQVLRLFQFLEKDSEALSKWRRIETSAMGIAEPGWSSIPRHYPSEGGLKHFWILTWKQQQKKFRGIIQVKEDWNYSMDATKFNAIINSEALSKWRRIETHGQTQASLTEAKFRGIIQVKEDWNRMAICCFGMRMVIPRHYPSEGGLKHDELDSRIVLVQKFRGIIQVKEDWNKSDSPAV